MSDEAAPRQSFTDKHRKVLLGSLAVAMFIAAWKAAFLFVPFNKLFISKPDLIWNALVDLIVSGDRTCPTASAVHVAGLPGDVFVDVSTVPHQP